MFGRSLLGLTPYAAAGIGCRPQLGLGQEIACVLLRHGTTLQPPSSESEELLFVRLNFQVMEANTSLEQGKHGRLAIAAHQHPQQLQVKTVTPSRITDSVQSMTCK